MFGVALRVVGMAAVGWTLPFLLGTALARGQQAGESTIDMQWAVKIPARDGVKLKSTVLKEFPPHLVTIVPEAAAHPGVDFPFQYNIFGPYDMQWLTFTSGVTGNGKLFGDSGFWAAKSREMYMTHSAFQDYDKLVGNRSTVFQKWLMHPSPDAYYDAMVPNAEQYKRMSLPILTITGHYDGDQPGAFTFYKRHMQYGTAEAKANHYLIIGPWDHAGTRTPKAEVGGLKFGQASLLDLNKLHTEWYDWAMKGGAKPEFLKKRVAYYLVGAEEWKYADRLESISNATRTLVLGSNGEASDEIGRAHV